MIPLQPWLMPLLVMTVISGIVAVMSGVSLIRRREIAPKVRHYARIGFLATVTLALIAGAVLILIFGDEVAERLIAVVTFIPVAISAYLTFDALTRPVGDRRDGRADRVRRVFARREIGPGGE